MTSPPTPATAATPTSDARALLLGGVLPAMALGALLELLPLSGVSLTALAALLCVALLVGAWRARRALAESPYLLAIPLGVVLTAGIAAAFPLLGGMQPITYAVFGSVGPTLMGWAIVLWVLGTPRDTRVDSSPAWEPPAWALPVLLVASFALIAVVHWLAVGTRAIVSDEVIYLLQSKWMWQRDYAWYVDRDLVPFFAMRKLGVTPSGGLYGQYTPGWPLVLALFDLVGLRWWSGAILGTASVWATYRVGTLLYGRGAGVLGATLLLVHPWFLLLHAGYMAHAATILSLTLAALWLLEGETATGWARTWRWLMIGVAIALAVTVRTLTGVALGASLGLWLIVRGRTAPATIVRCAVTVVIGALPLAAWFLHYNLVTNGDAFTVSYQALHGDGYNLGFGTRGFTGVDEAMRRVPLPVTFTPRDALAHLFQRLAGINFSFLPYALLVPALLVFAASGHRPRWRGVLLFLLLPACYFFYWGSEIRFYSEYLPLLLAWCAAGLLALWRRQRQLALALLGAVLGGSALLNVPGRWSRLTLDEPWVRSDYTGSPARFAAYDSLEALQRRQGPLLVFVQERSRFYDVLFDRLWLYNMDGLSSSILVARDLGARNAELVRRFPERTPYLLRDNGRERSATIAPFTTP